MGSGSEESAKSLLDSRSRTRLQHVLRHIISTGDYLLPFLQIQDEERDVFILHETSLKALCGAELGFDPTAIINCRKIEFDSEKQNDFYLFDLMELFLVFSRPEKREDFVKRLQEILDEEETGFKIHGHMITKAAGSDLINVTGLIANKDLKRKLNDYYSTFRVSKDYKQLAALSADILQLIFSSDKTQDKTQEYSKQLLSRLAEKWSTKAKSEELSGLLGAELINAKKINNKINDIRHTDKHTIAIATPSFYKVIAERNIALVELVIMSLPEEFLVNDSPDDICKAYAENFGVKLKSGWIIRAPEPPEIDLDDIPF